MKKIIMSIICCFLFIFGFGNIKKVEATEKPQSVDGKTEYYGAMALDGNCSAHLVAYVEITFYQNTYSGAYMQVSRIRTNFESKCGGQKGKVTSTASVGTKVKHGSDVYVTQYFKCPKHGNKSVTAKVGGW